MPSGEFAVKYLQVGSIYNVLLMNLHLTTATSSGKPAVRPTYEVVGK